MGESRTFTVDVFQTVCARLTERATDLRAVVVAAAPFEEWLKWEAFLACALRKASAPFCEVTAEPTYDSEGVADVPGSGALRVGGPNDGADHCWLFAELVLIHDGNRTGGEWRHRIEACGDKLKRLGWKKSAALLIVVEASADAGLFERGDVLAGCAALDQPPLTASADITLPGGGAVVVRAFDVKRDRTDVLTDLVP